MHVSLVLLALVGLSVGAPQNWPYPDSLMPYRYGYPGQVGQYKYLPELEDDEDIGPYLSSPKTGRQDLVVAEGQSLRNQYRNADWRYGDGAVTAKPTEIPGVSVIETGSVAPVKENEPSVSLVQAEPAPPPKVVSSVVSGQPSNKPVQPPAFPPARPPPTDAPKEKDEDEEDDDDSEEDDADDEVPSHPEQDDETDTEDDEEEDADDDAEGDDDDDDDDDRRRQEPLNDVVSSAAPPAVPSSVAPPANQSVVASSPAPVLENNEVPKPVVPSPPAPAVVDSDDESSEEVGIPPVEALVPGYITPQGEVLVPVDTVIGDQPISVIDDPTSPPVRGVALHGPRPGHQTFGVAPPFFYPQVNRQDESDEVEDYVPEQNHLEGSVPSSASSSESPAGRNEFLNSFPPSRTPELFAVIQSRIPVHSNSLLSGYQVYRNPNAGVQKPAAFNGPYSPYYQQQQKQQQAPVYNPYVVSRPVYNPYVRQGVSQGVYPGQVSEQAVQGFSVAFALMGVPGSAPGPMGSVPVSYAMRPSYNSPFAMRNTEYSGYPGVGYFNNRYQGPYSMNSYRPQSAYYQRPVGPVPMPFQVYRRPVYPNKYGFQQYGNPYTGPVPNDAVGPYRTPTPQINNRIVINGAPGFGRPQAPFYAGNRPGPFPFVGYRRPVGPGQVIQVVPNKNQKVKPGKPNKRKPVKAQDDEPYAYESTSLDDISVGVDSSSSVDSYEQQQLASHPQQQPAKVQLQLGKKSRRNPKMAKKPKTNKKGTKKPVANPDPLNIFKKSKSKSRRN